LSLNDATREKQISFRGVVCNTFNANYLQPNPDTVLPVTWSLAAGAAEG